MSDRSSSCPIASFYSYKGGTGRTMAVANVGWLLAANGYRVLMLDWDLEAPGLHRYVHPFLEDPDLATSTGLIDWATDVMVAASEADSATKRPPPTRQRRGVTKPPEGHTDSVVGVAWSPDGTRVASASSDSTVRIWDPTTATVTKTLTGHTDGVLALAWSPDGDHLATAGRDHTVRIWDPTTATVTETLAGHTDSVLTLAWSPDGTALATAGRDHNIRVWDIFTATTVQVLTGHTDAVWEVTWSPDGNELASGSRDGTIRISALDSTLSARVLDAQDASVLGLAWSPGGDRLATASSDNTIRLWDPTTGEIVSELHGHADSVLSLAWSPDALTLASSSSDHTVKIWDLITGTTIRTLTGHTDTVWEVAWSADGTRLASASSDNSIKIWEAPAEHEADPPTKAKPEPRVEAWWEPLASLISHTLVVDYPFPDDGLLHLVPAGRQDAGYAVKATNFDWQAFYQVGGGVLLERLKDEWRADYDIVLIDSRTGLSDTAGICTVQLPDDLVVCFTLNRQSITGAAAVTESVCQQRVGPDGRRTITVWPLPCRIELAEYERLEAAREEAQATFGSYLGHMTRVERRSYWDTAEVPYQAYFAYEEVLAAVVEHASPTLSILTPYLDLAERLIGAPVARHELAREERDQLVARFVRSSRSVTADRARPLVVLATPDLQAWMLDLVGWLRQREVSVWMTDEVPVGLSIADEIRDRVGDSAGLVLLVGPDAPPDFAEEYLALAREAAVPVIPVVSEAASPKLLPHIADYQWLRAPLDSGGDQGSIADPSVVDEHLGPPLLEVANRARPLLLSDPEDPHMGQWGGRAEQTGRQISAVVRQLAEAWFDVELIVTRTSGAPLTGDVVFYLHPRLEPPTRHVAVIRGRATTSFRTWGAFTVGATCDGGTVRLELDLATLVDAPQGFKDR